ncbi:dTDP-4-dehydrorhamnose 3,5-epimerase family protein [Nonomuraea cavernae]|uniref:dTDP-4-dehydrorhamnose 3,5-epimerase n=1 Tax=Nonomuraea cavernae TaxID=2045107 RepID=A0A917ZKA0_9ACTN|nr:dTDP-4-dehydrorhamnose 3,5-epimerase family protein [Nonomuraea cavernae]MCA2189498.1 dTDP-4-dehydrorhamnose 3,5-epimerase family protein [Nonomuraea cavernae]GGO83529.1 dTDP-4-dehydrorhamnose 3,5-epimerase [Nonomuraea cavernae]
MSTSVEPLRIEGSFLVKPEIFPDERGHFLEMFQQRAVEGPAGGPMPVAQVNCSVSRRGTIRGVHSCVTPPGQARYVTCVSGAILDVIVDIRPGSPTYGEHVAVPLDEYSRHAVYLAEGLGHAFAPLSEQATVVYLCSTAYNPGGEICVNPLDPELALPWAASPRILSDKDAKAPTLREAEAAGLLPAYAGSTLIRA